MKLFRFQTMALIALFVAAAAALAVVSAPAAQAADKSASDARRKEAGNLAQTAIKLQQTGRYTEAVQAYEKLLQMVEENARIRYNLGIAYYQAGKVDEAIDQYRRAIKLEPKYAKAHANLALALADLGKDDEALAEYALALKGMPNDPDLLMKLGVFYDKRSRYDEAKVEFEKAIAAAPSHAPSHYYYAKTLYNTGDYAKAWSEAHRTADLDPELIEKEFTDALRAKLPEPAHTPAPRRAVEPPDLSAVDIR